MQRLKIRFNLISIIIISNLLIPALWLEISSATNKIGESSVALSNEELNSEVKRLSELGREHCEQGQYDEAVQAFSKALKLSETLQNKALIGRALNNLGYAYVLLSNNQKAIDFYLQALKILLPIDNKPSIATAYLGLGRSYSNQRKNQEALTNYKQALLIYKSIGYKDMELIILNDIGRTYTVLEDIKQALEFYKKSQAIAGEIHDIEALAEAYYNIGRMYDKLDDKQKALNNYEQALLVYRSSGDKESEVTALRAIGNLYFYLGKKEQAISAYLQSIYIAKTINDKEGLAGALSSISYVYSDLGDKQKAISSYQETLEVFKSINDKSNEIKTLIQIGDLYAFLGNQQKALQYFIEASSISEKINDQTNLSDTFSNIGNVYLALGDKQQALNYYERALLIYKSTNSKSDIIRVLIKVGRIYSALNEKRKAEDCYKQSLSIAIAINDQFSIADVSLSLGYLYSDFGARQIAHSYYKQSINASKFFESSNNLWISAASNINIGIAYYELGEYQETLIYYEKALPIYRAINDPEGEANTLEAIGMLYLKLQENQKALDFFGQSLALYKEIGSHSNEVGVLDDLSQAAVADNRPELGIFFLKQSVNTIQSLRNDILNLPKPNQQTFANNNANSYRKLAILLLEKGRILEAQQVLDLLKIDEIDNYLNDNKRGRSQTQEIVYIRSEQSILEKYNELSISLLNISQKLGKLKSMTIRGKKLSVEEQAKLAEYDKIQTEVRHKFRELINNPDVERGLAQANNTQQQRIPLELFERLRNNLTKLGNAALVYPLVLPDRIELIITMADSPSVYRTVKVAQTELNQAILDYRDALQFPSTGIDPKVPANKLYRFLIEPLESDLKEANIKTILYAPDGALRYIPLAALYDGNQWIAQRFAVNNLTAVSITDLDPSTSTDPKVLAGAYADKDLSYKVQAGNQPPVTYHGLPFAGEEVNDLAASIPRTDKRIDQAFSLSTLKPLFSGYDILHFATHAEFFPGSPEDSFILFGNGEQASLSSISDWSLNGVDLVVLSACDSGLGIDSSPNNPKPNNIKLGSGTEILGLGYQFQRSGAKATIASLWSVDDGGTQSLMSSFYKLLSKGDITKVEALRQAQVQLITKKVTGQSGQDLTSPHYWAPFFLIGNGF